MSKILNDLYSGNLFPAEQIGTMNAETKELTKELNVLFEDLKKRLGKSIDLLSRFEETSVRLNALYQEAFFIEGFKLGLRIATEALNS